MKQTYVTRFRYRSHAGMIILMWGRVFHVVFLLAYEGTTATGLQCRMVPLSGGWKGEGCALQVIRVAAAPSKQRVDLLGHYIFSTPQTFTTHWACHQFPRHRRVFVDEKVSVPFSYTRPDPYLYRPTGTLTTSGKIASRVRHHWVILGFKSLIWNRITDVVSLQSLLNTNRQASNFNCFVR